VRQINLARQSLNQPKKEWDQNNLGQNNSDNLFLHYFVLNYFDLNRLCLALAEEAPKDKNVSRSLEPKRRA